MLRLSVSEAVRNGASVTRLRPLALTRKNGPRLPFGLVSAIGAGQQVELGYAIAPEMWDQGYATEAAQIMIEARVGVLRTLPPPEPDVPVLDCCTGTADLALEYQRAGRGLSPVIGSDFCREMLELGNLKVRKAGAAQNVVLIEADTQRLPLPDDTFGVVTVAWARPVFELTTPDPVPVVRT